MKENLCALFEIKMGYGVIYPGRLSGGGKGRVCIPVGETSLWGRENPAMGLASVAVGQPPCVAGKTSHKHSPEYLCCWCRALSGLCRRWLVGWFAVESLPKAVTWDYISLGTDSLPSNFISAQVCVFTQGWVSIHLQVSFPFPISHSCP